MEQNVVDFVSCSNVFKLNDDVVNKTIELRRKYKKKMPDAIISATAINHKLTLVTRNIADFKAFEDLSVLDPWNEELSAPLA
ncbi:MAG: type II toxin-antitoxin system VapC family toxin [Fibromonadaceae bacterium]|nr:type II toxin-antitoxin system VapC family toxin [Fibromonadaceae bacterium]